MIDKNINLSTLVGKITGIGEKYSKLLKSVGINNVRGLIFYFPRCWNDFSVVSPIAEVKEDETVTIKGNVWQIKNQRSKFKRKFLTLATIVDKTGSLQAVWYNQFFLTKNIKPNCEIILSGLVTSKHGSELILQNPTYEVIKKDKGEQKEMVHVGRIVPIYSETKGLSSRWLRFKIKPLLFLTNKIKDYLPKEIRKSQELMKLSEAVKQIHFPDNNEKLKEAKQRLAFDELFLIQLSNLRQKIAWQGNKGIPIKFNKKLTDDFIASLSFKLTNSQKKSVWEILKDLEKNIPMNRLLEGDVGSGKTVVAALAILETIKKGFQVAYMAPTEILARQHFQTLSKLFKTFNVKISLMLGSTSQKDKKKISENLKNKKIELVIGTHALLQEHINFSFLALIIIDEQHRFGVEQRATLRQKIKANFFPHLLTMTATPIPRTLALALYGDLDLSIISEMPPGRQKVITKIIRPLERQKTYDFIRKEVAEKNQIFVICPLIEESDSLGVKSAKQEYEKLSKKIFPDIKIAILHGKMKSDEKEKIMKRFQRGRINILVSTSVVEVGIDIPRATVMMIEGAERFGLAQLHQFRGRVGRGEKQSYCFLFTDKPSKNTFRRLYALIRSENGFELAEKDLSIRGPGEIYGLRQHGLPDLKMASLNDWQMIKKARSEAEKLLKSNSNLKDFPALTKELSKFKITRHLE